MAAISRDITTIPPVQSRTTATFQTSPDLRSDPRRYLVGPPFDVSSLGNQIINDVSIVRTVRVPSEADISTSASISWNSKRMMKPKDLLQLMNCTDPHYTLKKTKECWKNLSKTSEDTIS